MALPAGLSTVTIQGGPYADPTGAIKFVGMVGKLSLTGPLRYNGGEVEGTVAVTVASDGTFTAGPLVNTSDPAVAAQGVAYRMEWQVGRFDDCPGGSRSVTFTVAAGTVTADYDVVTPVSASAVSGPVSLPFVTSVQGRTGAVTLTAADVGAAPAGTAGGVASVNTKTGTVVLSASDVGADAAGAATSAQAFAIQRANHTGTQAASTVTGLATVATSGAYTDLSAKPTIPTVADYLPKWKPSTAYTAGDAVLNPAGQVVTANATFTSGASYNAANWTVSAGGSSTGVTATVDGAAASTLTITTAAASDIAALVDTRYVKLASNLSDLPSPSTARTNLGLGTAATQASGVASGVATLDGSGNVPLAQLGNVGSTAYNAAVDPSLHNLNTWTFDPISASGSTVAGTGVTQYVRLRASKTASVSTAYLYATSAGSGLTAGIVALLDSAGNNLGTTADQATAWSSTGLKAMTFGSPISLTAGQVYYLAFLPVGTTGPGVARGPFATAAVNAGIGSAPFRFGNSGSGQTSIGATVTLTTTSASTNSWWAALG